MSSQTTKPMLRSYRLRFPHGKSSETVVQRITAQLQVSEVATSSEELNLSILTQYLGLFHLMRYLY